MCWSDLWVWGDRNYGNGFYWLYIENRSSCTRSQIKAKVLNTILKGVLCLSKWDQAWDYMFSVALDIGYFLDPPK